MAEKIKFCKKCGKPKAEGAKFCRNCGYQFVDMAATASPANPTSTQAQPVSKPVNPNRTSIEPKVHNASKMAANVVSQIPGAAMSVPGVAAVAKQAGQMINVPGVAGVAGQVGEMLNLPEVAALAQPGEFALDDFVMGTLEDVVGPEAGEAIKSVTDTINTIKSPLSTLLGGAGSVFTGIFKAFKQPKVLLTSAVMAVVWIILGMLRNSDSEIVKILSWLTFSEGGFDRDALGTLGGVAGKGAVAVMFGSLLSGGISKLTSGVGAIFKKTEGKKSVVALLFGVLLGIIIYFVFTGVDIASAATAMAGISGAVLSLEALGGQSGWIYQMAASLTAKKVEGVRTLQDGKINSLLGGITAGFAIVTAMTSMW